MVTSPICLQVTVLNPKDWFYGSHFEPGRFPIWMCGWHRRHLHTCWCPLMAVNTPKPCSSCWYSQRFKYTSLIQNSSWSHNEKLCDNMRQADGAPGSLGTNHPPTHSPSCTAMTI